jgi:hypothetical protein
MFICDKPRNCFYLQFQSRKNTQYTLGNLFINCLKHLLGRLLLLLLQPQLDKNNTTNLVWWTTGEFVEVLVQDEAEFASQEDTCNSWW